MELPRGIMIASDQTIKKPTAEYNPKMTLDDMQRQMIEQALRYYEGNKVKASISLGITCKTLYNYMHKYDLFNTFKKETFDLDSLKSEVNFKNGSWKDLTSTQVKVGLMLLKAKTNAEIAKELGVKPESVCNYCTLIYRKTDVRSRQEFIVKFSHKGQ